MKSPVSATKIGLELVHHVHSLAKHVFGEKNAVVNVGEMNDAEPGERLGQNIEANRAFGELELAAHAPQRAQMPFARIAQRVVFHAAIAPQIRKTVQRRRNRRPAAASGAMCGHGRLRSSYPKLATGNAEVNVTREVEWRFVYRAVTRSPAI